MKPLKQLSDLLIYGNFLIAFAAASITAATYLIAGHEPDYIILSIVFLATLFIYTFDRLMIMSKIAGTDNERHMWVLKYPKLLVGLAAASFIALIPFIFFLRTGSIIFLAHVGLLSLAYSVPFIRGRKNVIPLRSISLLKIFLITYVWVASTVIFPFIESQKLNDQIMWLMAVERALFIFGITLPFDIRDHEADKKIGLVTIPAVIGVKNTKMLAAASLALFTLVSIFHYENAPAVLLAMSVSGISTLMVSLLIRKTSHEYFFTGLLDTTLIIQTMLILIFQQFT